MLNKYFMYDHRAEDVELKEYSWGEKRIHRYYAIRMCDSCKSLIVGYWAFPTWIVKKDSKDYPKDIYESVFEDAIFDDHGEPRNMGSYCDDNIKFMSTTYETVEVGYRTERRESFNKVMFDVLKDVRDNVPEYIGRYKEEAVNFHKMTNCPVCGEKFHKPKGIKKDMLSKNAGYYYFNDLDRQLKYDFDKEFIDHTGYVCADGLSFYGKEEYIDEEDEYTVLFKNNTYEEDLKIIFHNWDLNGWTAVYNEVFLIPEAEKRHKKRIEKILSEAQDSAEAGKAVEIKSLDELKKFLLNILNIEKDINFVTERLKSLYLSSCDKDKDYIFAKNVPVLENSKNSQRYLKLYEKLSSEKPYEAVTIDQFPLNAPAQPQKPQKPVAPILKKPGFFNKKRVLEENAQLTAKYEAEMSVYEEADIRYKAELTTYYETIERLKKEQNEKYLAEIERVKAEHSAKCDEAKAKYEEAELRLKEFSASMDSKQLPQKLVCDTINNEIALAEELLKKLFIAREQFYSCGVLFDKYRNFVAVAMFYEYLSAGRCSSLEGADGAYNIYESELRSNIIISKLSDIVESLEKIKDNQYMIYSAINEANKRLDKMNRKMGEMIESVDKIADSVEHLEKTAETIAYNTEVNAFYSKKNAELTDALGYMVALR